MYYGVHQTSNLFDGYLGSGRILRQAIAKYNRNNFAKIILKFFNSSEEMFKYESEYITQEIVDLPNTYNLKLGGHGGFDLINQLGLSNYTNNVDAAKVGRTLANQRLNSKYGENWPRIINAKAQVTIQAKRQNKQYVADRREQSLQNLKHARVAAQTPQAKLKRSQSMAIKQAGNLNSQFGTMWISNVELQQNKKIKNTDTIPSGWIKGRKKFFNKEPL